MCGRDEDIRGVALQRAHEGQLYVGPYWDYEFFVKATYEYVKGFYDRAFGDADIQFMGKHDDALKEKLEMIIEVLDKWVQEKYIVADEQKMYEELAEAFRLLGKCLPGMWD